MSALAHARPALPLDAGLIDSLGRLPGETTIELQLQTLSVQVSCSSILARSLARSLQGLYCYSRSDAGSILARILAWILAVL